METTGLVITTTDRSVKSFFQRDDVKKKFTDILGKRGNAFTSSVLTLINQSDKLMKCKSESVYMCAMMAATLDLPVNSNLGFAYIIPYGELATFQVGYKGFIQLAMRSGQFKTISSCPVYAGQLTKQNPLTGFEFDFTVIPKSDEKPIGYAAYFSLINGFEKTNYMTLEQVTAHGKKYSKTFSNGPWKTDFESMALKTVTKLLLAKYAPLSVEMQQAIITDQAAIKDVETLDVDYVDEGKAKIDKDELWGLYELKKDSLSADEQKDAERILKNSEEKSYTKLNNLLMSK